MVVDTDLSLLIAEAEVIVSVIKGQGEAGITFTAQRGGSFGGDAIKTLRKKLPTHAIPCYYIFSLNH